VEKKATPDLSGKLYRCLEIAMSREDLGCHLNTIVIDLADVLRHPEQERPTLEVWCDYFIKKNGSPDGAQSQPQKEPTGEVKDDWKTFLALHMTMFRDPKMREVLREEANRLFFEPEHNSGDDQMEQKDSFW
jgi:hypothetical protein